MKKRILFLIFFFIAWLPVFIIQKPWFIFYNNQLAGTCSPIDFLQVIAHGLLLDCTVAGYLTALPLFLTLASVWIPGEWLRKTLKVYFLIASLLISIILCGGILYALSIFSTILK